MRTLATLTFQTLDGVMQAPSDSQEDRSGGFTRGGWARPYWAETMEQVAREAMAEPYDLLLGGATYDSFAAHFSRAEPGEPLTARLNDANKYVVTSRVDALRWRNATKIDGDVQQALTQLKTGAGPLLQVHGSWRLVQSLLSWGLVDELRLWTFPVVVGCGKRLFPDGATPAGYELIRCGSGPSGVVMQFYRLMRGSGAA